jgi:hypothetical protein
MCAAGIYARVLATRKSVAEDTDRSVALSAATSTPALRRSTIEGPA